MDDARNVMTEAATALWRNGNTEGMNGSSPAASSPNSSSKSSSHTSSSRRHGGGNRTHHQNQQRRFLQVLPFRGNGAQRDDGDDGPHPRPGATGARRRRPRLLTEETWWVLHHPIAQSNNDNNNNEHDPPAPNLDHYTKQTQPHRTGILGRIRMKSVDHDADNSFNRYGSPPEGGPKHRALKNAMTAEEEEEEDADDTEGTGADDEHAASVVSSTLSTLSNVSERRLAWDPQPPVAGPTVGATDAQGNPLIESTHFQLKSVPLEIFVPIRSRGSSNVPEWLKISSRSLEYHHQPKGKANDDWLEDSDGDDQAAREHHRQEEFSPVPPSPPPPPPESSPSPSSSSPLRQLLLPRLAPLVTTEPSPSIPRPTLGKHSQSAPVADLYSRGYQRRQFPPVTPTSTSSSPYLLARPQSLHQIPHPRRRPQSMATATAPREASLSFRSAYSSCGAMSTASSTANANASQLSNADKKLLGGRERYHQGRSSARFQKTSSASSVLTLSVGSLVGQSSWVTAPGMTVATSSGSFEPASGGGSSPRSRRTALTAAADDEGMDEEGRDGIVAVSLQEEGGDDDTADGIQCGSIEHRRRVSSLRHASGGDVVSRWMDRGVAWMSSARHLRRPKRPVPLVRVVATKGGPDAAAAAAATSQPDLKRSSGCLT
jgi:hypothetical protein